MPKAPGRRYKEKNGVFMFYLYSRCVFRISNFVTIERADEAQVKQSDWCFV